MQGLTIEATNTKTYLKSCTIVYQGDQIKDGFIINKGVVRVYQIGPGGDSLTITFCTEGDIFPIGWTAGDTAPSMYYYEAFEDVDLQIVDRENWQRTLIKPGTGQALADYTCRCYQSSLIRIAALEQAKARDKIAYTVFYLLLRHSREIMPGIYRVEIKLKHQDIAELVGLTRETTAIEVHALQEAKVLSYQNQRYLIKREKLLDMINEEGLRNLGLQPLRKQVKHKWL